MCIRDSRRELHNIRWSHHQLQWYLIHRGVALSQEVIWSVDMGTGVGAHLEVSYIRLLPIFNLRDSLQFGTRVTWPDGKFS
jgi:hypothetical protein